MGTKIGGDLEDGGATGVSVQYKNVRFVLPLIYVMYKWQTPFRLGCSCVHLHVQTEKRRKAKDLSVHPLMGSVYVTIYLHLTEQHDFANFKEICRGKE